MKRTQYQADDERGILTALIVHDRVMARIAAKVGKEPFSSKWSNLVFKWCLLHFQKYETAPRAAILSHFRQYAEKASDEATVSLVEKFLTGLSEDYTKSKKEINEDFTVDQAARYFTRVQIEKQKDKIEDALARGDVEEAAQLASSYTPLQLASDDMVSLLDDPEPWREVLIEDEQETLIRFGGCLDEFFQGQMQRDAFIAFLGPEKRGKCVAEGTLVLMSDGRVVPIEKLVQLKNKKDKVLSWNENIARFEAVRVSQFWSNGVKPCTEILTKAGRKLRVTDQHLFLTPTGWRALQDLKVSDFIGVPRAMPVFGNHVMKSEEVRFIAYMLAEGCCVSVGDKGAHACNWTNLDVPTIKDFHLCCDKLGFKYNRRGKSTFLYKQAKDYLARFGIMGKLSKKKVIPDVIFELPKYQVAEFLRVFFTCDGTIFYDKGKPKIQCGLASEVLLRGLSHLLNRFGVVHKVTHRKKSYTGKKGKKFDSWSVSVGGIEFVNLFLEEINFDSYKQTSPFLASYGRSFLDRIPYPLIRKVWESIKRRGKGNLNKVFKERKSKFQEQLRLRQPMMRGSFEGLQDPEILKLVESPLLWDSIKSITPIGSFPTYDLGIKGNHNFVAADVIVHNSFLLFDVAWRAAMKNKRRTILYSVGDMSQRQMMKRIAARAVGRPIKAGGWKVPKRLRLVEKATALVKLEERSSNSKMCWRNIRLAVKELKQLTSATESTLKLKCTPNSTTRVADIEADIQDRIRMGWVPEVVVIDYADILAPERTLGDGDMRHQTDETWKALRRLSQKYHMLVVTATQANAASYDKSIIRRQHFSEDKRKLAHVTGMVGINQTEEEKERGLFRLNWVLLREGFYAESRCVTVAGCLAIANPCMLSAW